ncbi:G-alpha-domain-containing protein [Vararia minispora EC-137]|uniref:G-alpha-domain-containing protein n=1 Tax=Vararia minispora EC-137 TaxID=1314806 RepID=A0ACB8Q7G5_9AGAM|nr:G-alpha-domain-containing protein [Vararia minispora EC-137]
MARGNSISDDDPLSAALAPPPNETPQERQEREQREAEARRVSDEIDEQLRNERIALKRRKPTVKVLLLGQSESGKSTTLKNFQMQFAQDTWTEERSSWRAVIQLNLVRSINYILDLLSNELSQQSPTQSPTPRPSTADVHRSRTNGSSLPPLRFTEQHRLIRLRLTPLKNVQNDLEHRLGAVSQEAKPGPQTEAFTEALPLPPRSSEAYVQSRDGWRSALAKIRNRRADDESAKAADARARKDAELAEVIAGCAEDMRALWEDPVVREMLKREGVHMEHSPGFFLNDIERVARTGYEPSDNDVVRARLRTLGVQQYNFLVEQMGHEWQIFDVGGARSLRTAWYPYFDDVNAIIFLAPISCFDERLREDRRVNRLEDSFLLWQTLCSLKLLARTQIILFLNKCDLLERKLLSGVRVKNFVPSFGDRSNDVETVKKYFQAHFKEIAKQYSPEPRRISIHLTSVIDTKATAATLQAVEEGILRDSLRRAELI